MRYHPLENVPLPGILGEIEAVSGRDIALQIAARHGGTAKLFPAINSLDGGHQGFAWLVDLVGLDEARRLAKGLGLPSSAMSFDIPLCETERRAERYREIIRLSGLGQPVPTIARKVGLHQRSVRRLLSRARQEGRL